LAASAEHCRARESLPRDRRRLLPGAAAAAGLWRAPAAPVRPHHRPLEPHGKRRIQGLFTWNASRRRARRAAEEAIRRAREGGEWDGNVYRPKSFNRKDKDRKIH